MKTLRLSLILFTASAGLALAADSTPARDPNAHERSSSSIDAKQASSAASALKEASPELSLGPKTRVSGPLVRVLKAPHRACQLINPFAPASEGGLEKPAVGARPRAFYDPVTQGFGVTLVAVTVK